MKLILAIVLLCAACSSDGDGALHCPTGEIIAPPGNLGCTAPQLFAARDTAGLFPTQAEVDRYVERWTLVRAAEPILEHRRPQRYRSTGTIPTVYTRNPQVIAAWRERVLETGDPAFDAIFEELRITGLHALFKDRGDGSYYFAPELDSLYYSEEVLQERLAATSSWLADPVMAPRDDGVWTWLDRPERDTGTDESTAQIDFTFGWGDCLSGCWGLHRLRAVVPPGGPATVYDLGGDPLPEGWALSPNTRPLP